MSDRRQVPQLTALIGQGAALLRGAQAALVTGTDTRTSSPPATQGACVSVPGCTCPCDRSPMGTKGPGPECT